MEEVYKPLVITSKNTCNSPKTSTTAGSEDYNDFYHTPTPNYLKFSSKININNKYALPQKNI